MSPQIPRKWTARAAATLLVLAAAAGCSTSPTTSGGTTVPGPGTAAPGGAPVGTPTPGGPPTAGRPTDGTPSGAAAQLADLPIVKAGSMAGYRPDIFGNWRPTGKNCDIRDAVLMRTGANIKLSVCKVVSGNWTSPYDGKPFTSPTKMVIDRVVPLANAWRSGAATWTALQRADFANDMVEPQLIAVSAAASRAKGDQDPSTWKPALPSYWCKYATDWIAVKTHWKLSMTAPEKAALTDMLGKC